MPVLAKSLTKKAKKSKKQRKVGRNAVFCNIYRITHRRERNKLIRLAKHLKRHPHDGCAIRAAENAKNIMGIH